MYCSSWFSRDPPLEEDGVSWSYQPCTVMFLNFLKPENKLSTQHKQKNKNH